MTRFSRALEKAIFERDKGVCQICGRNIGFDDGVVEHKLSEFRGGDDKPENLQWACHRCNLIKGKDRSNEEVRRLLLLPENFDDLIKIRTKKKVATLSISKQNNRTKLKHSKHILLTRTDYQGLEDWAKVTRIENLIKHAKDKLETSCILQHFETGYREEFWLPLMRYKSLLEKYDYPIVPFPQRFQEDIFGYGQSLRDPYQKIPENDRKQLIELKEHLLNMTDKIIFGVKNGVPLKGRCEFCS